jgi:DNA repair ATPase RecN
MRSSARLALARSLVEINKTMIELKILRERGLRLLTINPERKNLESDKVRNLISLIDNYLNRLEALSERIKTLSEIIDVRDLREIVNDLAILSDEISKKISSDRNYIDNAVKVLKELERDLMY